MCIHDTMARFPAKLPLDFTFNQQKQLVFGQRKLVGRYRPVNNGQHLSSNSRGRELVAALSNRASVGLAFFHKLLGESNDHNETDDDLYLQVI